MKSFTRAEQMTTSFLHELLEKAHHYKTTGSYPHFQGKLIGNVFFNPSLRTKLSFEAAMARGGGQALNISAGNGTWAFESESGVRMNGDKPEHLKEAVRVMSHYVDALGVRSFAGMESLEDDARDTVLAQFEEHATVPVISLESTMEHPCQMVADMLTISEIEAKPEKKNFCLRWAPHVKGLPMAVPHSAILGAAHLGMNITIAAPEGYELHEKYVESAEQVAKQNGGSLSHTTDPEKLPPETTIVYVKSWGARKWYGSPGKQQEELRKFSPWMVRASLFQKDTHLLHCLPVRRNVVATDDALDHERSHIIQQAGNRLWGQLAVLDWIFQDNKGTT